MASGYDFGYTLMLPGAQLTCLAPGSLVLWVRGECCQCIKCPNPSVAKPAPGTDPQHPPKVRRKKKHPKESCTKDFFSKAEPTKRSKNA
eukprot:2124194-Amphidinium_carterae.1